MLAYAVMVLKISPTEFWELTWSEFYMMVDIVNNQNGKDQPMTKSEYEKMKEEMGYG